jgi:hypothetical protein
MLRALRDLPAKDSHVKRATSARTFLYRVAAVWVGVGLLLAFAAISLLISHTAFTSAFIHNSGEKKTAELMWSGYCSKPLHEVAVEQIEKELKRPLDCKWAAATRLMDVVEQSVVDSNIAPLLQFSRYQLKHPWTVIWTMAALYVTSLVVPFLAVRYYFRETQRRIAADFALQQKAFAAELTIAQRASLRKILAQANTEMLPARL